MTAADCKPGALSLCWSYGDKIDTAGGSDYTAVPRDPELQAMLTERLLTLTDMLDFGVAEGGGYLRFPPIPANPGRNFLDTRPCAPG